MLLTRILVYVLIVLLVARALRQFFGGLAQGMRGERGPSRRIDRGVRMVRDPICGTFVIPAAALAVRDANGVHHFCSDKCRSAFVAGARRTS
jgi:YHS domain-containing protein